MILASLGIFIVWAACMGSGLLWPQSELTRQAAIALVTLPVGVAWLVMECIHAMTPRRLFDRRRHAAFARLLHGTFVGTLGVLLSLLFLPLVDEWSPDAITLGFASAAAALICTLPRGRIAAGHCPHCDYDIATLPPGTPCPECGNATTHAPARASAHAQARHPATL